MEVPKKLNHKGNNGLEGKPSNNKGKKRDQSKGKCSRKSFLDVKIEKNELLSTGSDTFENLDHIPVTAHMYRAVFVKEWCESLNPIVIAEDPEILKKMGHDLKTEKPCARHFGEVPSCHTTKHWRKNVFVNNEQYKILEIARSADRKVRDYHFWMYYSGQFSRKELSKLTSSKNDSNYKGQLFNSSHICGTICLIHGFPESNEVNQNRKSHHRKMKEALQVDGFESYKKVRENCHHEPKCFINPNSSNVKMNWLN